MENTKKCSKCGRELPLECFGKSKKAKDGLMYCCRNCRRQYYIENAEHIKNKNAQNKEEKAAYDKQYNIQHKEERVAYQKQYYKTLKGYCSRIRHCNIVSDKKYERIGDELPPNYPTIEDYMYLIQQPDHYDGKQYDFFEMGLDRIDNSKPHTIDNIVPCTTAHNKQRGLMSYEEYKNKLGVSPTS